MKCVDSKAKMSDHGDGTDVPATLRSRHICLLIPVRNANFLLLVMSRCTTVARGLCGLVLPVKSSTSWTRHEECHETTSSRKRQSFQKVCPPDQSVFLCGGDLGVCEAPTDVLVMLCNQKHQWPLKVYFKSTIHHKHVWKTLNK